MFVNHVLKAVKWMSSKLGINRSILRSLDITVFRVLLVLQAVVNVPQGHLQSNAQSL